MVGVYSADSIRKAEEPLLQALPEGDLMQRAAYGLYTHTVQELRHHTGKVAGNRVLLLVGAGNNGGDTLWCGTFLRRRGVAVTAILLNPDRTHTAGLTAFQDAFGDAIPVHDQDAVAVAVERCTFAVDGIVGIGGKGAIREPAATIVQKLAQQNTPILSVDIPTGIDPDTGVIHEPHVAPVATVTFGALKPCHVLARPQCGRLYLVDIGLDFTGDTPSFQLLSDTDVADRWPIPSIDDNKYSTGVVGICAGSVTYPGAALLSVAGACAATSAMVRYSGSATDLVLHHHPDVVCTSSPKQAGRVDAWVAGPGMGTDDAAADRLEWILQRNEPVVLDADALTLISERPELMDERPRTAATLLTPHAGEFLRLCATYPAAPDTPLPETTEDIAEMGRPAAVAACRAAWAAQGINISILLKGRATYIAGDGGCFAEDTGSSWSATPGSGDVLSGVIGALVAHGNTVGRSVEAAAALAVRAHSRAAMMAAGGTGTGPNPGSPITASDLAQHLSAAIRNLQL